jgi:DNA-binding NarL/FixJ family response regulator
MRVAIVDYSEEVRQVFRAALEAGQFVVCAEAAGGREAVELAGRVKPDVLLLDLSMPDMGGLEALPLIRAASPGTRVVVLSAFGKRRYAQQAEDLGAAGFLEKHHPVDSLCARLREILRSADGGPPPADGERPTFGPW